MDNRICMVLEWTLEKASLLQDRSSLLQRQSTSQGTWETQNHQRLVLVSSTAACPILHDQSFSLTSEESLRDSKPPVTWYPRTKGQEQCYIDENGSTL